MASPNPKPSKSHPHQSEINPSQQQQQPNHQQREEHPVPHKSKPSPASAWADLPHELVEAILRRLPLEDYFPFGLACKPWLSAMLNVRALFNPPPVLILKPHNANNDLEDPRDRAIEAEDTRFYTICAGGERRNLPMIRPDPSARCCGSSMGWLFMVDVHDVSRLHLLNPLSGERVELPDLPSHVTIWKTSEVVCSKSSSDQDFTVAVQGTVAGVEYRTIFLTCRPKDDTEWGGVTYESLNLVCTYALYEGRLYVIARQGMDIYDLDPVPRKIGSVTLDRILQTRANTLLAIMDGKLLLVVRCCFTRICRVYEFVANQWVNIQSLGEWVLLMNQFTAHAFSTKESQPLGFRANCIYQPTPGALDVYSMEDYSSLTVHLPTIGWGWFQTYWFLAQSW